MSNLFFFHLYHLAKKKKWKHQTESGKEVRNLLSANSALPLGGAFVGGRLESLLELPNLGFQSPRSSLPQKHWFDLQQNPEKWNHYNNKIKRRTESQEYIYIYITRKGCRSRESCESKCHESSQRFRLCGIRHSRCSFKLVPVSCKNLSKVFSFLQLFCSIVIVVVLFRCLLFPAWRKTTCRTSLGVTDMGNY